MLLHISSININNIMTTNYVHKSQDSTVEDIKSLPVEFPQESKVNPVALLLNLKEASQILNCSTKSVRRLIDRGLLRANRALRHIRVSRAELKRFVEEN